MNKLARLFYDLSVYKEIVVEPFLYSLFRNILSYLIICLALGFYMNQKYVPNVLQVISQVNTEIAQQVPSQAIVSIEGGQLITTNLPTPFVLTIPTITSIPLVSIDPQADLTALASSSAIVAFGKTHVRSHTGNDNAYEITAYADASKDVSTLTIKGQDLYDTSNAILTWINHYRQLLPLFIAIFVFVLLWFGRLFQTLIYALVLRVIGSLFSSTYRFTQYWKITLHTIILAEVINTIVIITYGIHYTSIFTLAFIGTTILAFLNLPNKNPNA